VSTTGITYVEIGVSDLARSLDFYQGLLRLDPVAEGPAPAQPDTRWLCAGPALLRLVQHPSGRTGLAGWVGDDLQRGLRHVGFKVGDVPRYAEHLRDAGVEFTVGPLDAVGDVRLAFFPDPDGTNLEIIDGHLTYHHISSAALVERERAAAENRAADADPAFDHVAVTAANLDAALDLYQDRLGWEEIGRIEQDQDPRGFHLRYFAAGDAVLEVFTFDADTFAGPTSDTVDARQGLRSIGVSGLESAEVIDPDGVVLRDAARA
jgi:catechol 2,3-dioxygenase-like lactoylglutathione lyase family enzyme